MVHSLLMDSAYWGRAEAFKTKLAPRAARDRPLYAHRTRQVQTEVSERLLLPESAIPALLSEALAMAVQQRLKLNKEQSSRRMSNSQDTLLHYGDVRCGFCDTSLAPNRRVHTTHKSGKGPIVYVCNQRRRIPSAQWTCSSLSAEKLDRMV